MRSLALIGRRFRYGERGFQDPECWAVEMKKRGMNGNEIEVGEGKPKVEGQGQVSYLQFIAVEVLLVKLEPKEKKKKRVRGDQTRH